jgi:hypothetical protein
MRREMARRYYDMLRKRERNIHAPQEWRFAQMMVFGREAMDA